MTMVAERGAIERERVADVADAYPCLAGEIHADRRPDRTPVGSRRRSTRNTIATPTPPAPR